MWTRCWTNHPRKKGSLKTGLHGFQAAFGLAHRIAPNDLNFEKSNTYATMPPFNPAPKAA
nr:hypothetical protein [uncultured Kingella sp.]